MADSVIQRVRAALADARRDETNYRTMSDGSRWLAVPVVRQIAKDHYPQPGVLDKAALFDLCEVLLKSGDVSERTIALDWAFRRKRQYAPDDFPRFEQWLRRHVDEWSSCDDLCTHAFGHLVLAHPDLLPRTAAWTQSANRWQRRAAAVILIYGLHKGRFVDEAFGVADILLTDTDDMVQKGYGWMLKEASKHAPDRVFEYVMARRAKMPRTALRYAIEKLPPDLRAQAMTK